MKVRIFNCHHVVPQRRILTDLFATLVSGEHGDPEHCYLGDLDGENIAGENIYTEMRHQYYVWKNLLAGLDYVGFEHYRRVLFLDPWPAQTAPAMAGELAELRGRFQQDGRLSSIELSRESFDTYWGMRERLDDEARDRLLRWIARHDVILPRPICNDGMARQWKTCLPVHEWDVVVEAVNRSKLARDSGTVIDGNILTASYNNIYIMRSAIFDDYMQFFLDCIGYLSPRVAHGHRYWGHCGERLVNMYLYIRKLNDPLLQIHTHPYLTHLDAYVDALPNAFARAGSAARAAAPSAAAPSAAPPRAEPPAGTARAMSRRLLDCDVWQSFPATPGRTRQPIEGWNGQHPLFDRLLDIRSGRVIIDVGVWKGQSTECLAELLRTRQIDGCVIAVDTFLGGLDHMLEHQQRYRMVDARPDLMQTFLDNMARAGLCDFVLPLAQVPTLAAKLLRRRGVSACLVHLDNSRSFDEALADARAFWPLVEPGGHLVGDDYVENWPEVIAAAKEFAASSGMTLEAEWPKWYVRKPEGRKPDGRKPGGPHPWSR